MNHNRSKLIVLSSILFSVAAFAGAPEVVQAPVCRQPAEIFTVTSLTNACGQDVKNSGLRGAINRNHRCTTEHVVAQVYAGCTTCENCATRSQVAQIRCERGGCHVCENDAYITALIQDLASPSHHVRVASRRSLRVCGLRVTSERACTDRAVPSVVLY